MSQELHAVELRQGQIEHDRIGHLRLRPGQTRPTTGDQLALVPGFLQTLGECPTNYRIVFNYKNFHRSFRERACIVHASKA